MENLIAQISSAVAKSLLLEGRLCTTLWLCWDFSKISSFATLSVSGDSNLLLLLLHLLWRKTVLKLKKSKKKKKKKKLLNSLTSKDSFTFSEETVEQDSEFFMGRLDIEYWFSLQ